MKPNTTKLQTKWYDTIKNKGSPYSITKRRVPELSPVLGGQPAGDVNHKPGSRLPLLSARPAVTPATLKRAATNFAAWWTEARWVEQFASDCYPTASPLQFEPRPFCAWVQHANHSATEPPISIRCDTRWYFNVRSKPTWVSLIYLNPHHCEASWRPKKVTLLLSVTVHTYMHNSESL